MSSPHGELCKSTTEIPVRSRSDPFRRLWRKSGAVLSSVWKQSLVEYDGCYSLEKSLLLMRYRQSRRHQIVLTALTPWTCLICALLSELIPLEDPQGGWRACPLFFVRLLFRSTTFNAALDASVDEVIPEIALPLPKLIWLGMVQALCFMVSIITFAEILGVFPVPFTYFTAVPMFIALTRSAHLIMVRHVLFNRSNRERATALRRRFQLISRTNDCGPIILVAYAAYAMLFTRVTSRVQLVLAVGLQFLLVGSKWLIAVHARVCPGGDLTGEYVITFVYFFHSLFTTTSVSASKSTWTLVLLVGWNVVHDVLASRHLLRMEQHTDTLWHQLPAEIRQHGKCSLIEAAFLDQRLREESTDRCKIRVESSYWRHHSAAQHYLQSLQSPSRPCVPPSTLIPWLRSQTHLFHVREMVLLRLYVDISVPCIFLFFVLGVTQLPNRIYHPYVASVNIPSTINRVLAQVAIKLAAFVALSVATWRRQKTLDSVDEPSTFQHLTFTLDAQRFSFQSKLLLVGLIVLDFPLVHLGNDLTFRFDWIRPHHQPPT